MVGILWNDISWRVLSFTIDMDRKGLPYLCRSLLPSPSRGDGSSTGPMALWIDNSEKTAVAEVVLIYTRADLEGLQIQTQREKRKKGRKGNSVEKIPQ